MLKYKGIAFRRAVAATALLMLSTATPALAHDRATTAELIADMLGCDFTVSQEAERVRPESSEVDQLLCSNLKARSALGWTPKYAGLDGFKRGLEETIEWFSAPATRACYKSEIYNV